jgi:hypothetical protein
MRVVGINGSKAISAVADMQFIAYPTYFSGEYTLAKN